jgi:hypothetical protein
VFLRNRALARSSLSGRPMMAPSIRVISPARGLWLLALCSLGFGCVAASGAEADRGALTGVDETQEGYGAESASGPVAIGTKFTTTADLNLRRSASTSASILDVVAKGQTVTAVAESPSNGFYKVSHGSDVGWMYGAYLNKVSSGGGGGGGTSSTWSCTGSYGTKQPSDGRYDLTAFGCWTDASGVKHGDSGDNCLPGCFSQAKSAGLCSSSDTGKACEERVSWYVADAGRFGCLQRVKIVNPANGRAVVAVALDYGPACWVEAKVSKPALDASGRVNRYLFGADQGITDKANVVVTLVSSSTPLGPSTP